eukprot:1665231-Alexandrium_andersonii.AAC.1
MSASLVGSEMCIRDSRSNTPLFLAPSGTGPSHTMLGLVRVGPACAVVCDCLLYTSDAADDM